MDAAWLAGHWLVNCGNVASIGDIVSEALDEHRRARPRRQPPGHSSTASCAALAVTPPDALFRRLAGMLARKGYPPGVVIGVVKDALAERAAAADVDIDALAEHADPLG